MPIAFVLNGAWWLAFTIPLTKRYRQTHYVERTPHAVRDNFKRVFSLFSKKSAMPNKKGILLFLIAFFFYIDGVYTIIDMATSFGTALGFDTTSLLLALLVTQFVAFPAAIAFGKLAPKVHNDVLILISIIAYTGIALFAVFMTAVWQFWMLAVAVGLFQGGIQALSRSYFTKIIPAEQSGTLFGFLDIFAKGAAVQPIRGMTDQLEGDNQLFYAIYDNGAGAAMGSFAAYSAIPGVDNTSVFFEPINSLVSGTLTIEQWKANIISATDQMRANLLS